MAANKMSSVYAPGSTSVDLDVDLSQFGRGRKPLSRLSRAECEWAV